MGEDVGFRLGRFAGELLAVTAEEDTMGGVGGGVVGRGEEGLLTVGVVGAPIKETVR